MRKLYAAGSRLAHKASLTRLFASPNRSYRLGLREDSVTEMLWECARSQYIHRYPKQGTQLIANSSQIKQSRVLSGIDQNIKVAKVRVSTV